MNLCVGWYRISSFEGKSGYSIVGAALLGGVLGGLVGLIFSILLWTANIDGFSKAVILSLGCVLTMAGATLAVSWILADREPTWNGRPFVVDIELRCPRGFEIPELDYGRASAEIYPLYGERFPTGDLRLDEAYTVDGQSLIPATVPLMTSFTNTYLNVRFNEELNLLFPMPMDRRSIHPEPP